MSLGSVSQIALSGISAAQLVVDVVGNNLANARTVELSNTDVGQSLIDLSEASTLFRASVRVLETSEAMFDTLLSLGRPR